MRLPLEKPTGTRMNAVAIWRDSEPFVENSRGLLVHRPRTVVSYNLHKMPHIGVKYLCGNQVAGGENIAFLSDPPAGALVCAACEAQAAKVGLPSAQSIAGRHVCIGRLKAIRLCCHGAEDGSHG